MTTAPTSRRERLRTATVSEIKDVARRLLVTTGPASVTLRAIAREMGMTAPAIYRYFPSLDALVADLTADLYDELAAAVADARDAHPADDPVTQLGAMARSFRHWSITHPAEFGLMFGSPVPGVTAFEDGCVDRDHAGAKFGEAFLTPLATLLAGRDFPTPPPEVLTERLGHLLDPFKEHHSDMPIQVIYVYLSAWTRLYGIVALEVFGHLRWALTDVEPLFETELGVLMSMLSPPRP